MAQHRIVRLTWGLTSQPPFQRIMRGTVLEVCSVCYEAGFLGSLVILGGLGRLANLGRLSVNSDPWYDIP